MIERARRVLDALQHPFFAALTLVVGLSVFILPIAFWGMPGAQQFWGSYLGSITGLAAAIGAVFLNAVLDREKTERMRRQQAIAFVRLSLAEFRDVLECIGFCMQSSDFAKTGNITIIGPGHGLLLNLKDNWLPTPHTDKHIEVLAQQSQSIADHVIAYAAQRRSFIRLIEALPMKGIVMEWKTAWYLTKKLQDHASGAEVALLEFLAKHADPE
jgi:hypothetical protein